VIRLETTPVELSKSKSSIFGLTKVTTANFEELGEALSSPTASAVELSK
jgi:hypothetical protein